MAYPLSEGMTAPPGLERTSSWPCRNMRRHEATLAFNTKVMESMHAIQAKIELFETRGNLDGKIVSMHAAVEAMMLKVDSIDSKLQRQQPMDPSALEARVAAMELLLFRRSLADFKEIDKLAGSNDRGSIEGSQCQTYHTNAVLVEPESESSPVKCRNEDIAISPKDEPDGNCLRFDIGEYTSHIEIPTDKVQVLTKSCQTSALPSPRRRRCNGKAVQTDGAEASTDNPDRQINAVSASEEKEEVATQTGSCETFEDLRAQLKTNDAFDIITRLGFKHFSFKVENDIAVWIDGVLECAVGEWVPIHNKYEFQIGEVVKVVEPMESVKSGVSLKLQQGYIGLVCFIDDNGDIHVLFSSLIEAGILGTMAAQRIRLNDFKNIHVRSPLDNT